jgi:lysine 2,3-aminomutase
MVGTDLVVSDYSESIQYIQQHTEIRDLLISGGDPLIFSNQQLDTLLSSLRAIPHIRTIRIGSKVPAVLPMRIDAELCLILRRHRVWLSLHFIHPKELTEQTKVACQMLADHGVGMLSQTVLLRGVNDSADVLMDLFYGLLEINVKPYYLLQCDPVFGSAHFRTSVEKGIECIQSLHGRMAGHAIPQYIIDAPGGGGKIPLLSTKQFQRNGDEIVLKNYEGKTYVYPDPLETYL